MHEIDDATLGSGDSAKNWENTIILHMYMFRILYLFLHVESKLAQNEWFKDISNLLWQSRKVVFNIVMEVIPKRNHFILLLIQMIYFIAFIIDCFECYQGGDDWYGYMFWYIEFAWAYFIFSYWPQSGAIRRWYGKASLSPPMIRLFIVLAHSF